MPVRRRPDGAPRRGARREPRTSVLAPARRQPGGEGQNARLAAKLTGWKIDIKSQSQIEQQLDTIETDETNGEEEA